jgi:hypothetical protein
VVESLASGAGGQAVPVIAIQWDGPNGTFDKFLSSFSFPQLSTRRLRRDEPSEVDSIARKLVRGWRRGPDAASAESAIGAFMPNPDVDEWLPLAMQGLVMAFHVMSFDPTPSSESGDLAANMWGYVGSAKGALHPNEAEGDFRFVRFMSEYLYSGPVRDYLSGKDPFEPSYSIEEIARALGEESKSRQSSEGSPLAIPAILESFRRFAPKNVLDRFRRDFGDPDELGNDWSDRRRLPTGDLRAVAEAIRPYTSQFDGWRRREQTSLSRCRTFPEFMEGFSGLLRHYLQSLARSRPDTEVRLGHPDWHANLNLARRTFPASFEYLNIRDREEGRPGSGDSMPIVEYADLVVSFSDLLMWQLRKRAGRREWDSQSAFAPM